MGAIETLSNVGIFSPLQRLLCGIGKSGFGGSTLMDAVLIRFRSFDFPRCSGAWT